MEKYTVSNIYRGNVDFKAMTQNSALQVFFFFFFFWPVGQPQQYVVEFRKRVSGK